MAKQFTPDERRRLAEKVGVNEQYLYQCLTGRRDMGPVEARRVEAASDGELKLWDICQRTWAGIWPELVGKKGAPPIPEPSTDKAGA